MATQTESQTKTTALTPYQVSRYSRHIIMPQVGSVGQRKLLDAKVLMVGAGGLGSPIAIYLTLAGVGTVGLVDFDDVDVTNLQRQILHYNDDIGRPKVESAVDTLKAYNPDTTVNVHEEPISSINAMEIMKDYDVIVNGADNFPTRYLVNDAAYLSGKPWWMEVVYYLTGRRPHIYQDKVVIAVCFLHLLRLGKFPAVLKQVFWVCFLAWLEQSRQQRW